MAVRVYRTARWVPDDYPTVYETYVGDGKTQLTVTEPKKKEIQCFPINRKKPKKNDRWVYHSIAIASIAGIVATLLILVTPIISAIVIGASLAWLGFVGYANR